MKATQTKEERKFRSLFNEFYTPLFHYTQSQLNNAYLSEDVVSGVFASLCENLKKIDEIANVRAYLFRAVKNRCITLKEEMRAKEVQYISDIKNNVAFEPLHADDALLNSELMDCFNLAVNSLTPKCKTVFLMVKELGMKYREVAEMLDISEASVEKHMVKPLKAVRDNLNAYRTGQQAGGQKRY